MRFPPYYCVLLLWKGSSAFSGYRRVGKSPTQAVSVDIIHPRSTSSMFGSNPLKSIFGSMASSISNIQQQGMTPLSSDRIVQLRSQTDQILSSHSIGSWDDIRGTLYDMQTPDERNFRSNLEKGYGQPSPLHKLRLFDESNNEEDVRVTLFRDSASWCPYCQKVWMTLEQKRIPYRVEKINMRCYGEKPASFTRMQPSGNIPVCIIDGVTYNQSNDIMYALEEQFPENESMVPNDPNLRMKAQELLRLERTLFSAWMYWLTSGGKNLRTNFIAVLNDVEGELAAAKGGDFFLGEKVSIVDMMFMPFLERMCASLLYYKGFCIRVPPGERTDFPAVNRW